jgi:Flp pilus assembly protein CpaB
LASENQKKQIVLAVVAIVLIGGAVWVYMSMTAEPKAQQTEAEQAATRLEEIRKAQEQVAPQASQPPPEFERTTRKGAVNVDGSK